MESERTARRIGTFGIFPSFFFRWLQGLAKQQYDIQLGRKSRRKKNGAKTILRRISYVTTGHCLFFFRSVVLFNQDCNAHRKWNNVESCVHCRMCTTAMCRHSHDCRRCSEERTKCCDASYLLVAFMRECLAVPFPIELNFRCIYSLHSSLVRQ